jgi:glycine cleavage system aminomethyltransferase T
LKYYTFVKGVFAGVPNVMISATGYTGAGGVEIYFETKAALPMLSGTPFSMRAHRKA